MAFFKRIGMPGVEELKNGENFHRILELDFDDMIPFVLSNIRKPGLFSRLYMAINACSLIGLILIVIYGFSQDGLHWTTLVKQFIAGTFAGSILVIPFHELFHGLAYRMLGARKIKFGADLHQLIFFVTADRFPVGKKEVYFLALLPFAAINVLSLVLVSLWLPHLLILFGFFLLSHNLMCIGDFAIVNFVRNEAGTIYNFDEVETKKSYFYKPGKANLL